MKPSTIGWCALALAACGGRAAISTDATDVADAGVVGDAGTRPAAEAVLPGAGCGLPLLATQVPTVPGSAKGYTQFTVMGTGANLTDTPIAAKAGPRTFWVRVPADYDARRPYRVVFVGQGCGGFNVANVSTYQLYKEAEGGTEQAIYVALDIPKDMANEDCYDIRDGLASQEWEAFALFMAFVDAHYCVDLNKIYVAGYSAGGWLANMWGCYFSGWPDPPRKLAPRYHIRGQASYWGGDLPGQPACGGSVAAFWLHDRTDPEDPLPALARVGRTNGCDTNRDDASLQVPWHADDLRIGDVCRKFVDCPASNPVVFCETTGIGKTDQSSRMIPALKYFFDEIESGGVTTVNKCVSQCKLGDSSCGPAGGLRGCTLDAHGCTVITEEWSCGPGFTCCPTCGPGSVPNVAGCEPIPGCAPVPEGCRSPGTFCLDENTLATCTLGDSTPQCLTVTDVTPCAANQKCGASPSGQCQ